MKKQILQELVLQNLSTHNIASKLQTSQTNVRYWLKKFNLKTNVKVNNIIIQNGIKFKKCPQCNVIKELNLNNFYIRANQTFHTWCKICNNKISKEKQKQLKIQAVKYKGGKCSICNYNKYIGALEFHHLNPSEKEFSISDLRTYSWDVVKNELDKCICLCSNCHREIHSII